jgi:hypothetical protein
MNPISALVLLAFAVGVGFAPWRRPGWIAPARALLLEAGALILAVVIAWLVRDLAHTTRTGAFWGRAALLVATYWYACCGGSDLVRRVLELVPVGGVAGAELSRGMVIGILERALVLTLILINQFGALGLILAAKALARFRALDNREFAEYFLIGTLTSLLIALLLGVAVRFVVFWT